MEGSHGIKVYTGMIDALKSIYKQEGMRGLYKGFVPGMFGVSHGALQFMTYEEMKNSYNQYRKLPIDAKLVRFNLKIFSI
jgi:solute carrier family 25 (mitochondrial folate transporter), member 32